MTDIIENLASSLRGSWTLTPWERLDASTKRMLRDEASCVLAKFEEAGFVIMPKRTTEEILRVLYELGRTRLTPSRFYEKIIEAGQK